MQKESSEREEITKLFHDAFVRVCQLAIASCGVSVAELTLHLTVQLNTGVPQILSSSVIETVRSPLAKNGAVAAANGSEALTKAALSVDDNNVDSHRDDYSFDSSVHMNDVEMENFNGTLSSSCTSESMFTTGHLVSCPIDVNSADNLMLSEDSHHDVPLEEFLADVGKASDSDTYVTEYPMPPAEKINGENTREADKVYESSYASLSNPSSSGEGLVAANGACYTLSTVQLYNSDRLMRGTNEKCAEEIVRDSDRQGGHNDSTSLLQHCHFGEQATTCSNSACIAPGSVFSGTSGTELEADGLAISQEYIETGDRSSAEGDNSYEEVLVIDESGSCSDTRTGHAVATESLRTSLCSPVNRQPVCTEDAAFNNSVSLLKPYPADYLLSMLCHSPVSYSQQPSVLSISTNSCGLVKTNASKSACGLKKILSSKTTNVAAIADADRGTCLCCIVYLLMSNRTQGLMRVLVLLAHLFSVCQYYGCDGFQNCIRIRQNPALFPKSVGYLKSARNGFKFFVSVQLYNYFRKQQIAV